MRGTSVLKFALFMGALLFLGNFFYYRFYKPCTTPLPYAIGFIDPRQNITREQLTKILTSAETAWEKPLGKNLFQTETSNDWFSKLTGRFVTVNVRYDERQLKKNILTNGERNLDTQAKKLAQEKSTLELLQSQYASQKSIYEEHVSLWNKGKRTSQTTHNQLEVERSALEQLRQTVNDRVSSYNQNIAQYNSEVNTFNANSHFEDEAGTTRGRQVIDLYLLEGDATDAFLIAHELGHAIGIDGHASDENSLMYYRLPKNIRGINEADISLLTKACKW
jgi:chromosome segregation ATPase